MFNITLNRIHDKIRITEGDEALTLAVEGDAMRMVAGLSQAQKQLPGLNNDSTEDEARNAALYFAAVIFGKEQAEQAAERAFFGAGAGREPCGHLFFLILHLPHLPCSEIHRPRDRCRCRPEAPHACRQHSRGRRP